MSTLAFLSLKVTRGLHLVVNPLYLPACLCLLFVEFDNDTQKSELLTGLYVVRGFLFTQKEFWDHLLKLSLVASPWPLDGAELITTFLLLCQIVDLPPWIFCHPSGGFILFFQPNDVHWYLFIVRKTLYLLLLSWSNNKTDQTWPWQQAIVQTLLSPWEWRYSAEWL